MLSDVDVKAGYGTYKVPFHLLDLNLDRAQRFAEHLALLHYRSSFHHIRVLLGPGGTRVVGEKRQVVSCLQTRAADTSKVQPRVAQLLCF